METNRGKPLETRHGRKRKKGKIDETHCQQQQHKEDTNKLNKNAANLEKNCNQSLIPPINNNNNNNSGAGNNNCASNSNINTPYIKTKGDKRGNGNGGPGGGGNNSKFNFRAPQQFQVSKKKNWNKRYQKGLHGNPTLTVGGSTGNGSNIIHLQQISKADVENLPNIKNQISHHRQGGGNNPGQKNMKQQQSFSKKKILSGVASGVLSIRSKFFLSDKRPRKEIIIPPTKFLLGGNISDPLNLNSLQEEAQSGNATPSTTPRQSPVTTPPKIEVIIPPNIHDPLHLLDPVDSIEYEKQLVSPMKRKHRHRKKKPKRKRLISVGSSLSIGSVPTELNFTNALSNILKSDKECEEVSSTEITSTTSNNSHTDHNKSASNEENDSTLSLKIDDLQQNIDCSAPISLSLTITPQASDPSVLEKISPTFSADKRRSEQADKLSKELKLDLDISAEQQKQNMINAGRKRKSSEAGSCKNKFRRLDNMDKIVSPVVPQPGAWKRPPRNIPTGARKGSRIRSISNSETDIVSPIEESKVAPGKNITDSDKNVTIESSVELPLKTGLEETAKDKPESATNISNTLNKDEVKPKDNKVPLHTLPKFKPEGARYQYGNYDRYSGFNTVNEFIDIRLQVFQRNADLFVNKDVLDIGCNVGHMTIAVAKKLSPKSILGIDIDPKLIARARRNLSLYVKIPNNEEEDTCKLTTSTIQVPVLPIDIQNALEEKLRPAKFKEIVKKQFDELQKNLKNISKSKLKRKVYFELKKNKAMQKQKFAEQRRIQGHLSETFPISFPICYGPIPSPEAANFTLAVSPSIDPDGCPSGPVGGVGSNPNSNSSLTSNTGSNSANATPVRSLGTGGPTAAGSNIIEVKPIRNVFPKSVFFRQGNYVLKDEIAVNNEQQQYDLILCLSVTKWIHLNFGDAGLKLAFKRMFNQLRPGGKLILEAQNWASYKKKKSLTETIYKNYNSIEFFPNKFHEYLLSNEVGFSHSYTLGVPRHMSKGFCRPIQLYAKGDFTPNHVRWSDAYYPQTPYEAYRGIYASVPRPPYPLWGSWDLIRTPRGNSSSCRQTPYYNPLESDSYLPSYDTEVLNRHYVFASPLYQTVWSPPASLRNSSSHTPVFGSVREVDNDSTSGGSNNRPRHVYLPNDESNSPKIVNGAFNSIREEADQDSNSPARQHVYANCDSSSSPRDGGSDNDQQLVNAPTAMVNNLVLMPNERSQEIISDSNDSETA